MANITVKLVKIPVSSVGSAAPFYRDVLGLAEQFVVDEYGWAHFEAGNLPVALYVPGKGGGRGAAGQCDSLHLHDDDEAALIARLQAANIDTAAVKHTGNDGSVFYELEDPDGNVIKVIVDAAS